MNESLVWHEDDGCCWTYKTAKLCSGNDCEGVNQKSQGTPRAGTAKALTDATSRFCTH